MNSSFQKEDLPAKLIGRDLVLFDGSCVLCNKLAQAVLDLDEKGHFLLAAQQTELAAAILQKHGIAPGDLSSLYVVLNCGNKEEAVLKRSKAVLNVMAKTKFASLAKFLSIFPPGLLDIGYMLVAKIRYRIFGRMETCMLPSEDSKDRIIA